MSINTATLFYFIVICVHIANNILKAITSSEVKRRLKSALIVLEAHYSMEANLVGKK